MAKPKPKKIIIKIKMTNWEKYACNLHNRQRPNFPSI